VDPSLKGRARVMIVLTGVETNFTGMSRAQEPALAAEEQPKRKWWG